MIPARSHRTCVRSDPDAAFRGDPGKTWPPKKIIRRIRATENLAAARPKRYPDELLDNNQVELHEIKVVLGEKTLIFPAQTRPDRFASAFSCP